MNHLDMFEQAAARKTDPETSHEAAGTVRVKHGQKVVLGILREHGPMADAQLVELAKEELSPSGARTRRKELQQRGLVCFTGEYVNTPSGRRARVWAAVEQADG